MTTILANESINNQTVSIYAKTINNTQPSSEAAVEAFLSAHYQINDNNNNTNNSANNSNSTNSSSTSNNNNTSTANNNRNTENNIP